MWTPTQIGINNVVLLAADNAGDTTYQRFQIRIDAGTNCRNIFQHFSAERNSYKRVYNIAGKVISNSERMKYRKIELPEIRKFIDDLDKAESLDRPRLIAILYMLTHELESIYTELRNPEKT